MHYHDGHFWGMHFVWWIVCIVIGVFFFFFYSSLFQVTKKESPLEVLKRCFAKGEITKEEYEEAKKVLDS
ncbi:putative membrane protein [Tenacibaculum gallaicum]|uniref:Putative membrane protein n=1 Tax=Tenacibaculum gallaicum TaxID=561505 RepID=A0A3E0HRC4_9FLAO|nr:SHOCT domain-containing protein [Tenacibaculum gallaicum]REH48941.1 putative membrane protein [Tenacibaculum gallaicum]